MPQVMLESIQAEARRSTVLAKLEAAAVAITGAPLHILLCRENRIDRLHLNGSEADLPEFCRLVRSVAEGAKRCGVCRSLVALRACYQGVTDYCCHGGVFVVASPAIPPGKNRSGFVVVSSCAFADPDRARGWAGALAHAEGLPLDMDRLRAAYEKIPALSEEKLGVAKVIVELAACALSDLQRYTESLQGEHVDDAPYLGGVELSQLLKVAFSAMRNSTTGSSRIGTAADLVEATKFIVARNPELDFTVVNVARAARMTPNHFSACFHRYAGVGFKSFVTSKRIEKAKHLLGDPTLSVSEVAVQAGFPDPSHFSRRFRQITGTSPQEYRRIHCT